MTAEIIIMNKSAIALAADSAATLPILANGEKKYKIYNTSNKLFMLSKYYPVGILIYGNAEFLGYPWELVIKEYRKKISKQFFPTIKEYSKSFIDFLEQYFPIENQLRYACIYFENYLQDEIIPQINADVKKTTESDDKVSVKDIQKIIQEIVDDKLSNFINAEDIDNLPPDFSKNNFDKYKNIFEPIITKVFKKLPITVKSIRSLIFIALYLLTKKLYFLGDTGIVIAGFGEEEQFPAVYSILIDSLFKTI